jgi:hypothetical protein
MSVNYSGNTCLFDSSSNTYSRPSVKVRYPCRFCGSSRPEIVKRTPEGGYLVEVGECCPHLRLEEKDSLGVEHQPIDTED